MPNKQQRDFLFTKLGYQPSKEQDEIHNCDSRIRLVAGGERSGKSFSAAMDLISRMFEGRLYWLVAQDYSRTKAEYDYICEALDKLELRYTATKQVDPGEILVEGGFRIVTKSAKDPRKLAMEAPDGILGCEASQLDYETYLRLRGRLAEKRGWALLSGTFESSLGWYVEAYNRGLFPNDEELISFSMPTWANLKIFPGGRDDPEIKRLESSYTKEWFMERFGGRPTPPSGLVFGEFRNHIHTGQGNEFEFDPSGLVHLMIDPGYATAYSVLATQKRGEQLFVVDEIYEKGMVTSDVIKVCKQKPWWSKVSGGTIDVAGFQHQAMPAPAEVWSREAGVGLRAQKIRIQDGIERTKTFLIVSPITGSPLLHINTKCRGLISEMGGCPSPITEMVAIYKWREDRDGKIVGDVPEDKNNHSCKALSYGLVDLFGYSTALRKGKIKFF